ncbi:ABC transporter ATP-binding protein, partial [Vibrio parahaemolyticus]|nr:ABC transporter ATP-binding protein [Vibrio parahaemolyticus]NMS02468.1 ABC transporter ATP-binding protein [Vibrio parahaemolyticus]
MTETTPNVVELEDAQFFWPGSINATIHIPKLH